MFTVGDKVRLCIVAIEINGMNESEEQYERFQYILDHPDEVYEIASVSSPSAIAQISLNHPILGATSFFEEELILIEGDKV